MSPSFSAQGWGQNISSLTSLARIQMEVFIWFLIPLILIMHRYVYRFQQLLGNLITKNFPRSLHLLEVKSHVYIFFFFFCI